MRKKGGVQIYRRLSGGLPISVAKGKRPPSPREAKNGVCLNTSGEQLAKERAWHPGDFPKKAWKCLLGTKLNRVLEKLDLLLAPSRQLVWKKGNEGVGRGLLLWGPIPSVYL